LPLSRQTLTFTAGIIRKGDTFAELAVGFGISTATACRYVTVTVALLAARSRSCARHCGTPRTPGSLPGHRRHLNPIDRVAADRPFYSGKHRRHGMNLQVIFSPDGDIVWVSGLLPGAMHDLTAARIWGIVRELAASGLLVLGDRTASARTISAPPTGDGTSPRAK
jgi:hypothetical protein